MKKRLIFYLLVIILFSSLFSSLVSAYTIHKPILIENIHAAADKPYIIEGYEISSDQTNCIEVRNSENVIIRNNYLHDCFGEGEEIYDTTKSLAIFADKSSYLTIEENNLKNNKMGIYLRGAPNSKVLNNKVINSQVHHGITLQESDNSEIAFNYLKDNGLKEIFDQGPRIIGIFLAYSNNLDVHDNTVINSSSDGISAVGYYKPETGHDWTRIIKNVRIYNNQLLYNWEQGIWALNAENIEIFNNTIKTTCECQMPGTGIFFEYYVRNSEIYDNIITSCNNPGAATIKFSQNNYFHDNVHYGDEKTKFVDIGDEKVGYPFNDPTFKDLHTFSSENNLDENNQFIKKSGKEEKSGQEESKETKENVNDDYSDCVSEECNYLPTIIYLILFLITLVSLIIILIKYLRLG
ncbi:MAG: right-handed parallel beta-helix repeat-containing protein [Nanoarchaeota archaeon]|nr:right-handed parallel beta-helix repeat-containing protein [Nanoarchaeota archaeon]MBU1632787.1 right-handed parallel beta-helix repeat-containing protein [Nanoarchaeota archaeon]MBU1876712.1 right-handed parallel beta-helix repeat-containing protein [Nanoarchaeota archaeon]